MFQKFAQIFFCVMRKAIYLSLCLCCAIAVKAQETVLSLDSCRAMALRNNKELKITGTEIDKAMWNHKVAESKYMPRINALGGYMYSGRKMELLSKKQKNALSTAGTKTSEQFKAYLNENPALAKALEGYSSLLSGMDVPLNMVGMSIVNAFETDTHNALSAGVTLTQPMYMGGKIRAYNNITDIQIDIARNAHELEAIDIIVGVDETYWQIVSLQAKLKLAQQYLTLVDKLESDVSKMIAQGFQTKADLLSVKVKVNEAHVTIIQLTNGIAINKMKLCQLCGIDLNTKLRLANEDVDNTGDYQPLYAHDAVMQARANRIELKSLDKAVDIYKEKEKLVKSDYLPHVALTGSYLATNPSVYNSFEKKFKGDFHVGVVVTVPIVTCGERKYKMMAARDETDEARLRLADAREKIELQVNRNMQLKQEAQERIVTAKKSQDEANENLRCANLGLQENVIPVRDVIAAQTAWVKANTTMIDAQIDLRMASIYLDKSMGTLNYNHNGR